MWNVVGQTGVHTRGREDVCSFVSMQEKECLHVLLILSLAGVAKDLLPRRVFFFFSARAEKNLDAKRVCHLVRACSKKSCYETCVCDFVRAWSKKSRYETCV